MIRSSINWNGYIVNEVTDHLDKHTIDYEGCGIDIYGNYIYDIPSNDGIWTIRAQGATRGHIKVDDEIIKEIELYEDSRVIWREF